MRYDVIECGESVEVLRRVLQGVGRDGGRVVNVTFKAANLEYDAAWIIVVEYAD